MATQRRPIARAAGNIRDDAIMELSAALNKISSVTKGGNPTKEQLFLALLDAVVAMTKAILLLKQIDVTPE